MSVITSPPHGWPLVVVLCTLTATVVAAAAPHALRTSAEPDHRPTHTLSMADAIGVGGLADLRLSADAVDDTSLIARNSLVAYYGSPRQPDMGILGEHDPEALAWLLHERAARFDAVNEEAGVVPLLHIVYGVAQPETGPDGLYLRYLDDRTVRQYLDLARRHGFGLVLDLQIGHSTALAEVEKILPYLREPDVHAALDPEFALLGGAKPGSAIGAIDASDINAVQGLLGEFTRQRHLPKKLLIVHQFQESMITNGADIARSADVDLIIDMDGYGPAEIKTVRYQRFGANAQHGGIKLFLHHDPDLMSERALLDIEPRPAFFLYQ